MIKVIASDMDGTLLNSKIQVDEEGVKAIEQARAKGIHFVLCTGRMYDDAMQLINHANLYGPAICMNGAEIRDEHGKILKQIPIDKVSARYTYQVLTDLGMYCEFFTDIGPISPNKDKGIELMKEIQGKVHPDFSAEEIHRYVEERFESKDVHVIDDTERLFNNEDITILKFIAFSSDQAVLKKSKKNNSRHREAWRLALLFPTISKLHISMLKKDFLYNIMLKKWASQWTKLLRLVIISMMFLC